MTLRERLLNCINPWTFALVVVTFFILVYTALTLPPRPHTPPPPTPRADPEVVIQQWAASRSAWAKSCIDQRSGSSRATEEQLDECTQAALKLYPLNRPTPGLSQ